MNEKHKLDQASITERLHPGHFIERIHVLDRVESTNQILLSWAEKGSSGTGVLLAAEEQTAGQGRMGRPWHAVPGQSLTFSFLCRNFFPESPGKITLGIALAAAEAIEKETGVQVRIKWPNDLLAGGGKLAGVLAQPVQVSGHPGMVVGVGINVNAVPQGAASTKAPFPVCLRDLAGAPVDRSLLLAAILNKADAVMHRFADGESAFLGPRLRTRSILIGARARFEWNRKEYEGRVLDHTDDLKIILKSEEGRIILPGETSTVLWFE